MGLVVDGANAEMETGARAGLSLARRFYPSAQWSQSKLALAMGADNSRAEIMWCEYEKYCSCFNEGIRRKYVPRHLRAERAPPAASGESSESCSDFCASGGDMPDTEFERLRGNVYEEMSRPLLASNGVSTASEQAQASSEAAAAVDRPAKRRRVAPVMLPSLATQETTPGTATAAASSRGQGWRRSQDCALNTLQLRQLAGKHKLAQYGTKAQVLQRLQQHGVSVPGAQPVS